ncbi:MAG: hypothetical protein ACRD3E_09390 [Terriglobales bacterium]
MADKDRRQLACGHNVAPETIHSCGGSDYQAPVLLDILDELKRIRIALEKQAEQPPSAVDSKSVAEPKSKRRETR